MDMNTKDIEEFKKADSMSYRGIGEIVESINEIMGIVRENHFRAKTLQHSCLEEEYEGHITAEILYYDIWVKLHEALEEIPKELGEALEINKTNV